MISNHRIASGRAALAAEVVGRGDPVVFLHANVADSRMWRAQLDSVGATNKAIAYDRRGFGETRAEREDFSAIADLMAVLDAVGERHTCDPCWMLAGRTNCARRGASAPIVMCARWFSLRPP